MESINYGMLKGAIKFAIENNPENDGDYRGEDGLLMCGKCHTKKETTFNPIREKKDITCCI